MNRFALLVMVMAACAGSPTEATTLAQETSAAGATSSSSSSSSSTTTTTTTATTTATTSTASTSEAGSTSSGGSVTTLDPSTGSSGDDASSSSSGDPAECHPILSEVFNDPQGSDGMLEWIEITNPCHESIDLGSYSLAWGGTSYGSSLDLVGEIAASGCFVVGGPMSSADNFAPVFDQPSDFNPDLENTTSGAADGIALFAVPAADIDMSTVPVDALIYGDSNENGLIDETGAAGEPDVPAGQQGDGYARIDAALRPDTAMWTITDAPTPGVCPNPA